VIELEGGADIVRDDRMKQKNAPGSMFSAFKSM
jgi:hypothetical protein